MFKKRNKERWKERPAIFSFLRARHQGTKKRQTHSYCPTFEENKQLIVFKRNYRDKYMSLLKVNNVPPFLKEDPFLFKSKNNLYLLRLEIRNALGKFKITYRELLLVMI